MQKKYIVVDNEQIIIFSPGLYHSQVAGDMKVISAGFMDIQFGNYPIGSSEMHIHCYGESESLKVGSRPQEDKILATILLRAD